MKKYEVGEKVVDCTGGPTYVFEVVDEFPDGYMVWNIGRKNFPYENYIPLCEAIEGTYNIKAETLKMLYVEREVDALFILNKANWRTVDKALFQKIVNGECLEEAKE